MENSTIMACMYIPETIDNISDENVLEQTPSTLNGHMIMEQCMFMS